MDEEKDDNISNYDEKDKESQKQRKGLSIKRNWLKGKRKIQCHPRGYTK